MAPRQPSATTLAVSAAQGVSRGLTGGECSSSSSAVPVRGAGHIYTMT